MITPITDINELNKIIRNELLTQTGLPNKRVRNALSIYGSDLDDLLTETISDGANRCEELLLFELKTRDSSSNVSMTENDDEISIYKSYTVYIIIYGDNSPTLMNQLIARMRTQQVREKLLSDGVYIERVANDDSVNEFKNNVIWHRNDTSIDISCRMLVTQVSIDDDFDKIDSINIKKGERLNEY